MIIYLFRHAIASRHTKDPALDDEREITKEGRKKCKRAAAGFKSLGVKPTVILTSPLPRAAQTAAILAKTFKRRVFEINSLRPGFPPESLFPGLKPYQKRKEIVLVGHEPSLSQIVSALISHGKSANLELKKSGACAVETDKIVPGSGKLLWLLTSRQLRRLAKKPR